MVSPNILVIMSDEHAPMFSGAYGHPVVRTPHMERLASEGVTFDSGYCNSPLCVPSRMSFMTGRYPSRVGVYDNASPLRSDVPTWAHALRARGYDVALAGKQHFVGPDQLHGFAAQLSRDLHAEETHPAADWQAGVRPRAEVWQAPYHAGPGSGAHIRADDDTAEAAVRWLRDPDRQTTPWALCASFLAPHFPAIVPQQYWDLYPLDSVDMPTIPPSGECERSEHPVHRRRREILGLGEYSEDLVRRTRVGYYGLITYLDDKIGQLLDTLQATGQLANTLVVYISDHGEMNGEHGLWRKSNFYEQSVRVPIIMSWPAGLPRGVRVGYAVSLVDVVASMLAAADADPVATLDGEDLLPLARGECPSWKDEVYSEYLAHGVIRPTAMLRAGRYKLNVALGDPDELFDLENDPGEWFDLADDPHLAPTMARMRDRLASYIDLAHTEEQVLQSQQERLAILAATGWTPSTSPEESRRGVGHDHSLAQPGIPARPIPTVDRPETCERR